MICVKKIINYQKKKNIMQGVSDRYDRVVRVLGIETVDAAVQQDIRNEKALEEKSDGWNKCRREVFMKD